MILETIRKYIWVALAIAIVVLSVSLYKSCKIDDPFRELYDNLKVKADAQETVLLGHIADLTTVIAEKDERIAVLTEEIVLTTGVMDAHGVTIEELEAALENIDRTDYVAVIDNLKSQIAEWTKRYTLSEQVIVTKDKIIFNLTEKYKSQLIISNDYKTLWETEKELHGVALSRISVLQGQLRTSRLWGLAKNGVVLVLGGVIVYGLVTK